MRRTAIAAAATLCLWFTEVGTVRAEEARSAGGPVVRLGSVVGFAELGRERFSTLGAQVSAGYRVGPVVLEASYDATSVLEYTHGPMGVHNETRGTLGRSGVTVRYLFARVGPVSRGRSLLRLFAEVTAGVQRGTIRGVRLERSDAGVGGGWRLDYLVKSRPRGIPARTIGWHFGWRLAGSPAAAHAAFSCRTKSCSMPEPAAAMSLSVSSTLTVGF